MLATIATVLGVLNAVGIAVLNIDKLKSLTSKLLNKKPTKQIKPPDDVQ